MAPYNSRVVRRSHALQQMQWGRDFSYEERMSVPNLPIAYVIATGTIVGSLLLASPLHGLVERWMPNPGEGPSEKMRETGHWKMRFVAQAGEKWLLVEVGDPHGDPGYRSTSRMLANSAICLSKEATMGGMWTPASAFAAPLLARLRADGLFFRLLAPE